MMPAAFSKRSKNAVSRGMRLNMAAHPTGSEICHTDAARHCMADRDGRKRPGRRGLLIHGGALGDFVLSLRVLGAMRAAGMTSIAVLGRTSAVRLAQRCGIDEAHDLDAGGFHGLFGAN